jgi:hypothetical protein
MSAAAPARAGETSVHQALQQRMDRVRAQLEPRMTSVRTHRANILSNNIPKVTQIVEPIGFKIGVYDAAFGVKIGLARVVDKGRVRYGLVGIKTRDRGNGLILDAGGSTIRSCAKQAPIPFDSMDLSGANVTVGVGGGRFKTSRSVQPAASAFHLSLGGGRFVEENRSMGHILTPGLFKSRPLLLTDGALKLERRIGNALRKANRALSQASSAANANDGNLTSKQLHANTRRVAKLQRRAARHVRWAERRLQAVQDNLDQLQAFANPQQ